MSAPVIRVQGLSKRYRIGGPPPQVGQLREALTDMMTAPFKRLARWGAPQPPDQEFWALRDVSFEVERGEVLGIIGRNGAGKSTLLKIISRVTEPTVGRVELRGRVGSLLEVGTGFHPELTGRENVYLNGTILGMRKREIDRKFDEIVAFAEVERFIDTPAKRYSSGMYVRLAFAVAAHVDTEIMVADEVLAVGDLEFQKRCLGKMGDVSRSGRTVLLVSHQMNQIRRLCARTIWLDGGRVRGAGATGAVVAAYEAESLKTADRPVDTARCFQRWSIAGGGYVLKEPDEPFELKFALYLREPVSLGHFGVAVVNDANLVIAGWGFDRVSLPAGRVEVSVAPRWLPVRSGSYSILAALFDGGNNLTGGRLVELWQASPPLVVDSIPAAHPQDEWSGVLNVAANLSIASETE